MYVDSCVGNTRLKPPVSKWRSVSPGEKHFGLDTVPNLGFKVHHHWVLNVHFRQLQFKTPVLQVSKTSVPIGVETNRF